MTSLTTATNTRHLPPIPPQPYVVSTGIIKVPAGRYVVPTGKDMFIVSAGRTKVIPFPAGSEYNISPWTEMAKMAMLSVRINRFEKKAGEKDEGICTGNNWILKHGSLHSNFWSWIRRRTKALLSVDSLLNWSDHEGEDVENGVAQVYGMIAGAEKDTAGCTTGNATVMLLDDVSNAAANFYLDGDNCPTTQKKPLLLFPEFQVNQVTMTFGGGDGLEFSIGKGTKRTSKLTMRMFIVVEELPILIPTYHENSSGGLRVPSRNKSSTASNLSEIKLKRCHCLLAKESLLSLPIGIEGWLIGPANKGKQHKASYKAITAVSTFLILSIYSTWTFLVPTSIRKIDHKDLHSNVRTHNKMGVAERKIELSSEACMELCLLTSLCCPTMFLDRQSSKVYSVHQQSTWQVTQDTKIHAGLYVLTEASSAQWWRPIQIMQTEIARLSKKNMKANATNEKHQKYPSPLTLQTPCPQSLEMEDIHHHPTMAFLSSSSYDVDFENEVEGLPSGRWNSLLIRKYGSLSLYQMENSEVSSTLPAEISMITILDDLRTQLDGHLKVNQEQGLVNDSLRAELAKLTQRNAKNAELEQEKVMLKTHLKSKDISIEFLKSENQKVLTDKKKLEDKYLDEIVCLKSANKVATDLLQKFQMPTHTIPMLSKKPKNASQDLHKDILGRSNPRYGKKAPVINASNVWDTDETLASAEVSMAKIKGKPGHVRPESGFYEKLNAMMFVPQKELSQE
ncbi:hypothetical protein Tco_0834354 [Tanacetum coccineum]